MTGGASRAVFVVGCGVNQMEINARVFVECAHSMHCCEDLVT